MPLSFCPFLLVGKEGFLNPNDISGGPSSLKGLPELAADCSRCAALCCLAYSFGPDEDFAIGKDQDVPCPNLGAGFKCTIHSDLARCGFRGCIAYDCAGAGQRVTQELFQGETWQDDTDLLSHMTYALRVLRPIHEALLILREADGLAMPDDLRHQLRDLVRALTPKNATSTWDFEDPEVQEALAEVPKFIPSLAPYAS